MKVIFHAWMTAKEPLCEHDISMFDDDETVVPTDSSLVNCTTCLTIREKHNNYKRRNQPMSDSFAELSSSRFFKTEDVAEKPLSYTIKSIAKEEVQFQGKDPENVAIIKFEETDRQMIAKSTVLGILKDLFGTPSACVGQVVELFKDKTKFGGKTVDCLRLRKPEGPGF